MVKNPPVNVGDPDSIPESGRSLGEGNANPLRDFCLENPVDKRRLADYSPWGLTKSDMTE